MALANEHPDPNEARVIIAANLRALKGARRVSDDKIAADLGLKRSWVNERMTGARECKGTDLARFSLYFGVPVARFFADESGAPTYGQAQMAFDLDFQVAA